jgi:hypothetical protein
MKILILLLCVALTGCTGRVTPEILTTAETKCKNNSGIKYIDPSNGFFTTTVACNNDAKFFIK